jgi:hypothetical protein
VSRSSVASIEAGSDFEVALFMSGNLSRHGRACRVPCA